MKVSLEPLIWSIDHLPSPVSSLVCFSMPPTMGPRAPIHTPPGCFQPRVGSSQDVAESNALEFLPCFFHLLLCYVFCCMGLWYVGFGESKDIDLMRLQAVL